MKTLTLLRHAKSGWDDPELRDHDRPLNGKGERAARTVGRHLRERGDAFDRIVASTAVRVVETLMGFERGYGRSLHIQNDRRLYLASVPMLIDVIHEQPDDAARVMLVGHNPGMEELTLALAAKSVLRGAVEEKFPTASVAVLTFDVARWQEVEPGTGTLASFVRPRDLDPALGPAA